MSYAHTIRHGLSYFGLGVTPAQSAEARRLNEQQGVVDAEVGPGFFDDFLDAALTVQGVPSSEAGRVPAAVREVLEASGARVDRVLWGGGSGLESIRGKVYVRWKPSRPHNAVTYADIARRLFMSAADQFPAGARLIMHRYRIPGAPLAPLRGGFSEDKYVYPEGGAIPASAPEAAHRTTAENVPLDPGGISADAERVLSAQAGPGDAQTAAYVTIGVLGGIIALGGGYYLYRRTRMKRNRRRRRRRTSRS